MHVKAIALAALICAAPWASAQADHILVVPAHNVRAVPKRMSVHQAPAAVRQTVVQTPATRLQVTSVPLESRTVTQSVLIAPRQSDFKHRLDMLRDQIELGKQRGLMSHSSAATLSEEQAQLSFTETALRERGFTSSEDAWMEKSINVLNRLVSDAMN